MEENYLHCRAETTVPEVGRKVALITGITGITTIGLWKRSNKLHWNFTYQVRMVPIWLSFSLTRVTPSMVSSGGAPPSTLAGYRTCMTTPGPTDRSYLSTSSQLITLICLPQGKMILHYGDLIDGNCLVKIMNETKPTEIYNLGAQSHVKVLGVGGR